MVENLLPTEEIHEDGSQQGPDASPDGRNPDEHPVHGRGASPTAEEVAQGFGANC